MPMRTTINLLTNAETAELINILPNTLEIWRGKGKGPIFLKMGPEKQAPVRYRESDVKAWLEERLCSSTSQYTRLPKSAKLKKPNQPVIADSQCQPSHA